jgi:hypothetical protein
MSAIDNREEWERCREWLNHPMTKHVARKLRTASKGVLRKYDKCTPEELQRHQLLREILNHQIPAIIENMANPPQKRRWDWLRAIFGK